MLLSQLKPNETAKIVQVKKGCPLYVRLLDLGLVPGTEVSLLHAAPFRGPVEVYLRGYHLTLRRSDAAMIEVARQAKRP